VRFVPPEENWSDYGLSYFVNLNDPFPDAVACTRDLPV